MKQFFILFLYGIKYIIDTIDKTNSILHINKQYIPISGYNPSDIENANLLIKIKGPLYIETISYLYSATNPAV